MAYEQVKIHGQAHDDVPKLHLLTSPSDVGEKEDKRRVKFELFFDLWHAMISNITKSNKVAEGTDIKNFVGFFTILWFTWFMVCMFDVRFITDSIFERVIRIMQFGSMVGFTVAIYIFKPEAKFDGFDEEGQRQRDLFRNLSLILMAVRLSLVAQYCSAFWLHSPAGPRYIRNRVFKSWPDGWPILAAAAIHFVAAMVYLGIAFRFNNIGDHISKSYLVWYIGSAIEAILQFVLALKSDELLTFNGTNLTERLAVFTVVVLGEAVNGITKTILLVSENGREWSIGLTGIFVAAVATTYFLYLLYFDWMNHQHLEGFRQLLYSLLHFPFHAALLLFGAGSALFIKWWQTMVIIARYDSKMGDVDDLVAWNQSQLESAHYANKSAAIADHLKVLIDELDTNYPIKNYTLWNSLYGAAENITKIEDCYWNCNTTKEGKVTDCFPWNSVNCTSTDFQRYNRTWNRLGRIYQLGIYNSIFTTFEITPDDDGGRNHKNISTSEAVDMEITNFVGVADRVDTTFRFFFACTGFVLLFMSFFHALTMTKSRWSPFDYVRVGLFAAVAIALGLIPLMSTPAHREHAVDYYVSPWILPTVCLAVFGVLVLTHIHRPPALPVQWLSRLKKPRLFQKGRARQGGRHGDEEENVGDARGDGRAPRNYASLPSLERDGGH
ncbi:hypothetical protein PG985_010544 [Apiospora marii]|uniref:Uncharacterized protein n=1 Tax=Apiospora marii TaxID=335849 RepID=A0ABR1T2Q6_9PEZI